MPADQPNILLILSDQWSARVADGSPRDAGPRTPSIDRLARTGLRFDNAYCTFPVCVPARASLFTGAMPSQTRVMGNTNRHCPDELVPADLPRLGQALSQAGYECVYYGKDHSAGTAEAGVESFGSRRFDGPGFLVDGSLLDGVWARDAMSFLSGDHDRPFFMTLSFVNPHDICMTPPKVDTPNRTTADITDAQRWADDYLRGEDLPPLPFNHEAPVPEAMDWGLATGSAPDWDALRWRRFLSTYWVLIENTDWWIGQVLDRLEQRGLAEDTLVVFTTDHGDQAGAHGRIGKGLLFEESTRTPLLMARPGTIAEGQVRGDLASGADILPTLCAAAGAEGHQSIFGRDLLSEAPTREYVVCETVGGRMVRFGEHKYIRIEDDDRREEFLYNLADDPGESRDLAGEASAAGALSRGQGYLEDYYRRIGADISTTRRWRRELFEPTS
jgi:arylsulfatase A-like enzyme